MKLEQLLGRRFKEQPAEAFMASHTFLLRGGYIRQVGNGIFSLLHPAKRITAKIEGIIREEMHREEGQEVLFPVVLPADLWRQSGRFESVGSELLRMKDRAGRDLCLGMTHEEAAVHLARSEVQSYNEYPFMIYQIQTKFRDEPRARAGLIRVREFTMKDGYSFHTSQEDLEAYYNKMLAAYERIFRRVGLGKVLSVRSDSGMMGGSTAHEFMFLSPSGEDSLALCPGCGKRANLEVATCGIAPTGRKAEQKELVHTPGVTDIEGLAAFFGVEESCLLKSAVFAQEGSGRPVIVFLRGDYQVSEAKLRRLLGREISPWQDREGTGLCFGYMGPYGLEEAADVFYDVSLRGEENLICGGNRPDYHWKGIGLGRDLGVGEFVDLYKVAEGDSCPDCGGRLEVKNGIEVGNIFQLGVKYTKSMEMTYTDPEGREQYPVMGCYGIGVGRLMACILEEHHDQNGPVWPVAVAPWQVHICMLGERTPQLEHWGNELYSGLSATCEVLLDNRNVTAGIQFADADLLGAPVRVVLSGRGLKEGKAEIALRDKSLVEKVPVEEAAARVLEMVENLKKA